MTWRKLWILAAKGVYFSIGNYIVQGSYDPMRWGL